MEPSARLIIPAEASAAHDARYAARDLLVTWGLRPDVVDDALLAISEMVSNALLHGGTSGPLALELLCHADRLSVAVIDGSSAAPRARHAGPTDEGGRGLYILTALADRWGTEPFPGGKRVWLELDLNRAGYAGAATA